MGFHAPEFIPKKTGKLNQLGEILQRWDDLKSKFSILSGLEHQEAGHGHAGVIAFTTGRHPARHGGRRSISADQRVAEIIGCDTRFDSLTLQAGGGVAQGLSWSRSGARRGAISDPGDAFDHLFKPQPAGKQKLYLSLQTRVLDSVLNQSKTLTSKLGTADKAKFDEFQTSLRELELRATKQKQWIKHPFPRPPGARPTEGGGIISSMPDFVDLIAMAFQTDSARVVTLDLPANDGKDHRTKNRFRGAVDKNQAFAPDTDWRIESAVLETCVSILMNRQFLFHAEPDQPDGYSVASCLSYLL